ncbi:UNVERIFIED_CONTAM: hypothetical protein K2H54_038727 [Gekko kuhli]
MFMLTLDSEGNQTVGFQAVRIHDLEPILSPGSVKMETVDSEVGPNSFDEMLIESDYDWNAWPSFLAFFREGGGSDADLGTEDWARASDTKSAIAKVTKWAIAPLSA